MTHDLRPATLLIGLGNPGKSYAGNRHNAGFMTLAHIAEAYGFTTPVSKFSGALCEGKIDGAKTYGLFPLTYMNLSGDAAGACARFYKIPTEQIIVIHDELDLPLGKIRVKRGGGHGGHNGLKSLDAHLGQDYTRIRFGIGHPGNKDLVSDYVLSDFTKQELPQVEQVIADISRHIALLMHGDESGFMNKLVASGE